MQRLIKKSLLILLMLPLLACAEPEEAFVEGEHYVALPRATNTSVPEGKIEVLELFWYGCPHCYQLEPSIKDWLTRLPNDVQFVRMPAVMGRGWELHARAYYAASLLGVENKTHAALFDAIHKKRENLFDQNSLADFYARYGVKKSDFNQAFNPFSVNSKIMQSKNRQKDYRATGVPAIIVNGKYRVGTTMKAGGTGLFDVVDYLVNKEREAMKQD
ncbi:MAG: thiol:disulfide interchange protein DsbA/DsbL [Pseudomonadales bacterium]|nr:thiol:disulfide interchange protein DsbA/DsbL [Pseudomonadales bacterium]